MKLPKHFYMPTTLAELAQRVTTPSFASEALLLNVAPATLAEAVIGAYIERESAKLRDALAAALPDLEAVLDDERTFWGDEDKHGIVREYEELVGKVRAAIAL